MPKPKLILQTKLISPRIKEGILRRERLLNLLKKNINKKLILICGDAGYGKTTLLVQFCKELKDRYVFYSLEPLDNDVTTFLNYIIAGIQQIYKNFGKRIGSILGQTRDIEILVGTFINEFIENVKKDFYIIFDDYHHLHMNKEIANALDYLLHHQPANLHLIIASRATPPLDLSFYLAKQELFRLEKEQLQFKKQEIQQLLRKIYNLNISDVEIDQVTEHSEGWITAIQLIMQKIFAIGEDKAKETLNGYIASGEELFNYFAREVFENQPKKIQTFLLKTSFLERMNPKVCNEMLSIRKSGAILKRLEDEHIFISCIGKATYKYHHLFQKFINDIAQKIYSDKVINSIYSKISKIFIKKLDFESAIDYYLNGKQYKQAISCIKKIAGTFIRSCRFNRLINWIDLLPDSYLADDVRLMNIRADVLWHTVRIDDSLNLYKQAIRVAKRRNDHKSFFFALYGVAKIHTNSGNFKQALNYLKRCHKITSIKQKDLVDIHNLEGVCYIHLHNFNKGEMCFNKAAKILERYGELKQNSSLMNNIAIVAFTKGELEKSVKIFKQVVKSHDNLIAEPHLYSNITLCLIDLGRLKEARDPLKQSYKTSRQFKNLRGYLVFILALAFYYIELKDYEKALRYLNRLVKISRDLNERLLESKAKYGVMKTLYLAGNLSDALSLAKEQCEKEGFISGIRNHDLFLTKGLIEMESNDFVNAEATLLRALQIVEGTNFKYSLMRNYYHLAHLYHMMKKEKKTEYYLERALKLAKVSGYDYFLTKMAKRYDALLQFASKKGILINYANAIMSRVISESKITIKFFGNFEVAVDNTIIEQAKWQTRKAQLIFAYLIINRNRSVSKEELMNRFSAQENPSQANQEIRTSISRIQKALIWSKCINYERGFYKINKQLNLKIDTEEFENSVKHFMQRKAYLDDNAIEYANHAIALYRDDFLVSFYDNWCEEVRIYLRKIYLNTLNIFGEHYMANGNVNQALNFFQKILEKDPLNEVGNSGVIRCYMALSMKSEAIKHYGIYKKRLKKELKLEPSKEIENFINP